MQSVLFDIILKSKINLVKTYGFVRNIISRRSELRKSTLKNNLVKKTNGKCNKDEVNIYSKTHSQLMIKALMKTYQCNVTMDC